MKRFEIPETKKRRSLIEYISNIKLKCVPLVLDNSKWRVRQGNIYFWYDSWDDNGPICDQFPVTKLPKLKIVDCKIENGWDVSLLERLVGIDKADALLEVLGRQKEGDGVLVWVKNAYGAFFTTSA